MPVHGLFILYLSTLLWELTAPAPYVGSQFIRWANHSVIILPYTFDLVPWFYLYACMHQTRQQYNHSHCVTWDKINSTSYITSSLWIEPKTFCTMQHRDCCCNHTTEAMQTQMRKRLYSNKCNCSCSITITVKIQIFNCNQMNDQ